jgi:hypothetical protein
MVLVNNLSGGSKAKNFLPFLFRLAAGGLGGAALKMNGNFWVLPRASLSSAGEARKVIRFVQNMFERNRIIPPKLNFPIFPRPIRRRVAPQSTVARGFRALRAHPSGGSTSLAILNICFTQSIKHI